MKQPQLITFACPDPDCAKTVQALPDSKVTCAHGGTRARLRPPTIATRQKETAPS